MFSRCPPVPACGEASHMPEKRSTAATTCWYFLKVAAHSTASFSHSRPASVCWRRNLTPRWCLSHWLDCGRLRSRKGSLGFVRRDWKCASVNRFSSNQTNPTRNFQYACTMPSRSYCIRPLPIDGPNEEGRAQCEADTEFLLPTPPSPPAKGSSHRRPK